MRRLNTSIVFILAIFLMSAFLPKLLDGEAKSRQVLRSVKPGVAYRLINKECQHSEVVILDVRTPGEFATGHLENAINIDFHSESFVDELENLDRNKTYIVYCASGGRSLMALYRMGELGFLRVYDINGGIAAWKKRGLPVIR
ncbi:MAG: rhodanese-like domain-containing protein [Spirochaetota bacterium]